MDDKKEKLIADWHRRCRKSQRLNYVTGSLYLRYHYIVGVASIVLSAIVSSTFFSQIVQQVSCDQAATPILAYIAGILSISVGILSALQTFFRFSEKAEKYKTISAKYGAVRRQLEYLMTQDTISKNELERQLNNIRTSMDDLAANSLNIPARVKKREVKKLNAEPRKSELFKKFDIKQNPNGQ